MPPLKHQKREKFCLEYFKTGNDEIDKKDPPADYFLYDRINYKWCHCKIRIRQLPQRVSLPSLDSAFPRNVACIVSFQS